MYFINSLRQYNYSINRPTDLPSVRLFSCPFVRTFVLSCFIRAFVDSYVRGLFVRSLIRTFVLSWFIRAFVDSYVRPFVVYSCVR